MAAAPNAAPPLLDDRERFAAAWDVFFRAARRARARDSQRPEEGISLSQFHLLDALTGGPQPVGALAEAAGVAPPTATRMLDGLVRDGLVERTAGERDRRVVMISLTTAGRRAIARKRRAIAARRRRITDSLSDRERTQAAELLPRLADLMEEML